ncbi:MAG: DUF2079 domain-containing protein [Oscillospiraceae bacterium]|nr:DUF2079 domain-containing protein [Oscillospiraceae bacterium]
MDSNKRYDSDAELNPNELTPQADTDLSESLPEPAAESVQTDSPTESAADTPAEDTAENKDTAPAEASAEPASDTETADGTAAEAGESGTAAAEEKKFTLGTMVSDIGKWLQRYDLPNMLLSRLIAIYFLLGGIFVIYIKKKFYANPVSDWQNFIGHVSGKGFLICAAILVLALFTIMSSVYYIMPKRAKISDQTAAIGAILFFDITVLYKMHNFHLTAAVSIVSLVFILYELGKLPAMDSYKRVSWKTSGIIALLLTCCMTFFIAYLTIIRHKIFGTACHDFGLFVQMYYNLANRLSAMTTCERSIPISHFKIHASYFYYVLMPFYKLIPKPETLLTAQGIFAMGGAIPTFLICKRRNFKGLSLLFITLTYIFSVCFVGPCFYDFHENAFLPTLLMWLFWAIDTDKRFMTWLMALMVCIVKEDAPLYIVCIGMFLFFDRKGKSASSRIDGLLLTVLSGGYMLFITNWLTRNGDGQMMTSVRFGPMMINQEAGLTEVIKNVLLDPAFFFSKLMHEDTLIFFLEVMIPLLFLPFMTKKIHRFLLMIPFAIMNMAIGAGYGYAANIDFHYIFGPGALLLYMTILNMDDLGDEKKQKLAIMTGSASIMFFFGMISNQVGMRESYHNAREIFDAEHDLLQKIPEDAVICADSFLIPHCANRDYVYLFDGEDIDKENNAFIEAYRYDFIIIRPNYDVGQLGSDILEEAGWKVWDRYEERVLIYQNPNYPVAKPDVYAPKS